MKAIVCSVVATAVVALVWLTPAAARADDEPFVVQADGGSTVTSLDGGSSVTVDLGSHGSCYNLAMRCEGSTPPRYVLCVTSPCPVTAANELLDADKIWDIPVNCGKNVGTNGAKRYLSLTTDDGGVPSCKVQHSPF